VATNASKSDGRRQNDEDEAFEPVPRLSGSKMKIGLMGRKDAQEEDEGYGSPSNEDNTGRGWVGHFGEPGELHVSAPHLDSDHHFC
jgi:hypothetical protein